MNNEMNITDQLESIILKISDGFPEFGDYLAVKKLILPYFADIPKKCRVLLIGSCKTDVDYVYWLSGESIECKTAFVANPRSDEKLTQNLIEFDKIIIVSCFRNREI